MAHLVVATFLVWVGDLFHCTCDFVDGKIYLIKAGDNLNEKRSLTTLICIKNIYNVII